MTTILMPQLGEGPVEAKLEKWLVAVGDHVAESDLLFEVTTEKVTTEVPASIPGTIRELLAAEGDVLLAGDPICVIASASGQQRAPETKDQPVAHAANGSSARGKLSPVVRRLLREHGIAIDRVPGTGPKGRVTRNDVLAFVRATPSPPPAASRSEPLSPIRAQIAQLTAASKNTAPHVFSVIEVDMEKVTAARAQREGVTYLPFIARAAIEALRAFPALNASLDMHDGGSLVFHDAVHLGIAVDTDRGLFAPVIVNAGDLTVGGLGRRIADLAARTRAGEIKPEELRGSTFTITNPGAFGSVLTAPIINQPNVAILSTEAVMPRVVPVGKAIEIRHMMNLCMSWDHRAFDGGTAMRFLSHIKRALETRDWAAEIP